MLKKQYRLNAQTRFTQASSFFTPFFTLLVQKNELTHNRYGFVVSKKVDKKAVIRNRIRRQVRSCIEKNFGSIKNGYDMLFLVKKNAANKETSALCEALLGIFKKGNFYE